MSFRRCFGVIAFVAAAAFTLSAMPAQAQSLFRQANPHPAVSTAPSGPVINMASKGVLNLINSSDAACSGACNASLGDCVCGNWQQTGVTVRNLALNPVTMTFNATYNVDDYISMGMAPNLCGPVYGSGTFTNRSGTKSVAFFATGFSCGDISSYLFTDNMSYYIVSGGGTGAWTNARGAGTFALSEDWNNDQGIFSIKGSLQKNP